MYLSSRRGSSITLRVNESEFYLFHLGKVGNCAAYGNAEDVEFIQPRVEANSASILGFFIPIGYSHWVATRLSASLPIP